MARSPRDHPRGPAPGGAGQTLPRDCLPAGATPLGQSRRASNGLVTPALTPQEPAAGHSHCSTQRYAVTWQHMMTARTPTTDGHTRRVIAAGVAGYTATPRYAPQGPIRPSRGDGGLMRQRGSAGPGRQLRHCARAGASGQRTCRHRGRRTGLATIRAASHRRSRGRRPRARHATSEARRPQDVSCMTLTAPRLVAASSVRERGFQQTALMNWPPSAAAAPATAPKWRLAIALDMAR